SVRGHSGALPESPREMIWAHVHETAELRESELPVQIVLDVLRHTSNPALGQAAGGLIDGFHRKPCQTPLPGVVHDAPGVAVVAARAATRSRRARRTERGPVA